MKGNIMHWYSAVSNSPSLEIALEDVTREILKKLDGKNPDLGFVFISSHHSSEYEQITEKIKSKIPFKTILGCSASGVIGEGKEFEYLPGISLTAGILPDVTFTPFHFTQNDLPNPDQSPDAWHEIIDTNAENPKAIVLFPDPFSIRTEYILDGLDFAYPNTKIIGALASGGSKPGQNGLFLDDETYSNGCAGLIISGNFELDVLVAQSCRPIGEPMIVSRANNNVINELDNDLPIVAIKKLYEQLPEDEKYIMNNALQIGILMDRLGDVEEEITYMIRNISSIDKETGSITIGESITEGQIVQFHLRDSGAAQEELKKMLSEYENKNGEIIKSTLMFSSVGRGKYLLGESHHDINLYKNLIDDKSPITGFFSNGEISPIGDRTYLHGYTSSFAIFKESS
jgi:small ligand-binding sensory domain FIST|tara:strand:+ start:283 stop:1482 length:1200 start_codon:yes stop_codon:yes gene_type:complete